MVAKLAHDGAAFGVTRRLFRSSSATPKAMTVAQ
jgi:hypothetical protein